MCFISDSISLRQRFNIFFPDILNHCQCDVLTWLKGAELYENLIVLFIASVRLVASNSMNLVWSYPCQVLTTLEDPHKLRLLQYTPFTYFYLFLSPNTYLRAKSGTKLALTQFSNLFTKKQKTL